MINYWYSLYLREIGRHEKSVYYSAKAKKLDPLYPVIHAGHIVNCLHAGEIGLAKEGLEGGSQPF